MGVSDYVRASTRRECCTSEKNEPVDAYFLVSSNTQFLDQFWFSRQGSDSCQKPAIPIDALFNIIGRGTVNEKFGIMVDVLHALHATNTLERLDTVWLFRIIEGGKSIRTGQIKKAIVVFLVEAQTLVSDSFDFGTA